MYGYKNKNILILQLMKDIYALIQRDKSIAEFYGRKVKKEDLDYRSDAM